MEERTEERRLKRCSSHSFDWFTTGRENERRREGEGGGGRGGKGRRGRGRVRGREEGKEGRGKEGGKNEARYEGETKREEGVTVYIRTGHVTTCTLYLYIGTALIVLCCSLKISFTILLGSTSQCHEGSR